jgi:hypothetical protein
MENSNKKFTIEDLAQGRCAVINDGTVEELKEVLSKAFPNDWSNFYSYVTEWSSSKYYQRGYNKKESWTRLNVTQYPVQSVKDFLVVDNQPFKYEYKWYDVREVLPDERFDKKMVAVKVDGHERYYASYWDDEQEGFLYHLDNKDSLVDWVSYWFPIEDLPSSP